MVNDQEAPEKRLAMPIPWNGEFVYDSSSSKALASCRSTVSKPSVN
jgi:hypothetical protein